MDLRNVGKLLRFEETITQGFPVEDVIEDGIFLLKGERLGAVYEYIPYSYESLTEENRAYLAQAFSVLLSAFPPGYSVQVFMASFRSVKEVLSEIEKVKTEHPVVNRIYREMGRLIWKAGTTGLDLGRKKFFLKDTRVYLFVIAPSKDPSEPSLIDRILEKRRRRGKNPVESLRIVLESFEETARRLGLYFRRLSTREVLEVFYRILNPSLGSVRNPPEDFENFKGAVRESLYVWNTEDIYADGYYIKPVYVSNPPERTDPPLLLPYRLMSDLSCEFAYFMHIDITDVLTELQKLAKADYWTEKMISDPTKDVENVSKLREIREIRAKLYGEKELFLDVSIGFILYVSSRAESDAVLRELMSIFTSTLPGGEITEPVGVSFVFQNLLPFSECELPRFKLFGTNVGELFPGALYGQGIEGGVHKFFTPEGNVIGWDPFLSRSYHTAVLGQTNVGKSSFLQKLIVEAVAEGRFCFVLDRKYSYRDTVLACGGKWIMLSPGCGLNPFTLEVDTTNRDEFRKGVMYYLSYLDGLFEKKLTESQERMLKEALEDLLRYPVESRTFDVLYESIDDKELKTLLYPFTSDGRYGGIFGGNRIIPEGDYPVVCYEIDEIEKMRDDRLSRVVYLTLLTALYGFLEGRSGFKYVIMEEVPGLLKYPFMRQALEEQLQQYRKVKASVTIVIQDPSVLESFIGEGTGAVVSSQISNLVLYPVGIKEGEVQFFKRLGIHEGILKRLEEAGTSKAYRDFYLLSKTLEGEIRTFCRMILPPTLKFLTDSATESVRRREERVREYMREGLSYEEALCKLIEEEVPDV